MALEIVIIPLLIICLSFILKKRSHYLEVLLTEAVINSFMTEVHIM